MEIVLIDDHEVVRDGIAALIEQEYGWHVKHLSVPFRSALSH